MCNMSINLGVIEHQNIFFKERTEFAAEMHSEKQAFPFPSRVVVWHNPSNEKREDA